MLSKKWALAVLLLQLCSAGCGFCGKVLVWPVDMSHWLNIKTILEELTKKGHEVTVLTFPHTKLIDYRKPSRLNFEVLHPEYPKELMERGHDKFLDVILNDLPNLTPWRSTIRLNNVFIEIMETVKTLCKKAVYNQTLMKKLQETNYDVMLIDPVLPCGELVAELLAVPFVLTLRASMGGMKEKHCGKLPSPPSYVPVQMVGLTDQMTFLERVKNTMLSVFFDLWIRDYDIHFWDQFYSEALVIQNLTEEKGNLIATALAQIPQKVLWRYKGKKPATLGANTQLYDWLPQNDLLGHSACARQRQERRILHPTRFPDPRTSIKAMDASALLPATSLWPGTAWAEVVHT
ncbi:UDP-glucuronosyltransferase 2A3 [Myotis davidii]|uniref:UDP-glucuronosyltransferase 2A3 n=1 Tax=Myotis davidii TaxID=225400 RepID=L5MBT8_MYODS|nr:UDP-glucuronosyltransferase 2A3 [Myotis davidii]